VAGVVFLLLEKHVKEPLMEEVVAEEELLKALMLVEVEEVEVLPKAQRLALVEGEEPG
jgi:hypothetical protein